LLGSCNKQKHNSELVGTMLVLPCQQTVVEYLQSWLQTSKLTWSRTCWRQRWSKAICELVGSVTAQWTPYTLNTYTWLQWPSHMIIGK